MILVDIQDRNLVDMDTLGDNLGVVVDNFEDKNLVVEDIPEDNY